MTYRTLGIVSLAALALAACSRSASDDNLSIDESNVAATGNGDGMATGNLDTAEGNLSTRDPDQVGGMPLPPGTQPGHPNQPIYEEKENALIPSQYRGRWGMNANDCDPKQADAAKGLITIDGSTIRFYEARATLKEQRPAIATSFSGLFAFSGEGMTWEKVETLTRTGDMLKRADKDGTYNYKRCA